MLAREALRRLATPLAIAAERPAGQAPAIGPRAEAVRSVMRVARSGGSHPPLSGLTPSDTLIRASVSGQSRARVP